MRNGVNISGANARTYRIASTTLSDNGARFRVRVSNAFGNTLSNVATLSATSDKPPTSQILTPAVGTTYFGGMVGNYSGSPSDKEDGTLPAPAFSSRGDLHHESQVHPSSPPATRRKTSTSTIPTTA